MLKTMSSLTDSSSKVEQPSWGWIHIFILLQFAFQILLLFPQFGVLRVPIQVATFGLSLLFLVFLPGPGLKHPAKGAAIAVLVILALEFFWHPDMNTIPAGLAQWALYAAILGPLFWVSRLKITPAGFRWLILLLWGFHTLSAIFGVLQVYYPGQLQPYLSIAIQEGQWGGEQLMITLANGIQTYRPMGLTDTPGGAAMAGFYAILLGTGIALYERNLGLRIACIGSAVIGLFCIYLSQVRSILVFALVCLMVLAGVLARQAKFGSLTALLGGGAALVLATFTWAIAVGGESTLERFAALTTGGLATVYNEHRGNFLEQTLNELLPQYPLGAGLGRWGMISNYFGDPGNPLSQPIWVEIQWTGWLLDGGIPLILTYVVAIYFVCRVAWDIALDRELGNFTIWGGLIFAYDIGALAITFNYPLFIGQGGMVFWLLNTALFVAAHHQQPLQMHGAEP